MQIRYRLADFCYFRYDWLKVFLMYETQGHYEVIGLDTCYLNTKTLAQMLKGDPLLMNSYRSYEFVNDTRSINDKLVDQIGNDFGSEC